MHGMLYYVFFFFMRFKATKALFFAEGHLGTRERARINYREQHLCFLLLDAGPHFIKV